MTSGDVGSTFALGSKTLRHPGVAPELTVSVVGVDGVTARLEVRWDRIGPDAVLVEQTLGLGWQAVAVSTVAVPLEVRRGSGGTVEGRWTASPHGRAGRFVKIAAPLALAAGAAAVSRLRARGTPPPETPDDDTKELVALMKETGATNRSFMTAAMLREAPGRDARPAFERYFEQARRLLDRMLAGNERWPGLVNQETLVATATTLSHQLGMQADYDEAAGDRDAAADKRRESSALAAHWMGGGTKAAMRRSEAMTLASQGDFNEALVALDEARTAFLEAGQLDDAAHTSLYQANLYEWLGDVERAVEVLATVRASMAPKLERGAPTISEVDERLKRQFDSMLAGDKSTEGEDALKLRIVAYELITQEARLRRELGDLDASEALMCQTADYHAAQGLTAALTFHLAGIAVRRGQGAQAGAMLEDVAAEFDRGLLRPRRAALRMLQADALLEQDDASAALRKANEGVGDLHTYPSTELAWKLQWRRGRSLARLRRDSEALDALLAGADAADALRKSSLGYRLDTTFLRDKLPMFEAGIDLAAERRDGHAAVRLIELVKSRALSATLSIPRRARHHESPDEARFDELSARLDALDFVANASGGMTVAQRGEWESLLAQRISLMERMRIADPRWRGLSEPSPFDVSDLSKVLAGRKAAALTLFHRPGSVVAVLLAGGRAEVRVRPLRPEVDEALVEYATNLRSWQPDTWLFDLSAERDIGFADLIPGDLVDPALSSSALVVVPHGILHLVPWAGLSAPDGRRALEHTPISVLPNLTCLHLLDGAFGAPERAAIVGNPDYTGLERYPPLEHAAAEIREIAELYGGRLVSPPRTGGAATEAECRQLATARALEGGVLHVSAHGTLVTAEPLRSGLLFAHGTLLDAGELAQMRLAADEVVLSACSTGWRPQNVGELELAGDDALGLPAAALEAGARFVLVSISRVAEEPARELTAGYHRERLAGHAPANALNRVQRALLSAGEHEPWSWISTTAYGW